MLNISRLLRQSLVDKPLHLKYSKKVNVGSLFNSPRLPDRKKSEPARKPLTELLSSKPSSRVSFKAKKNSVSTLSQLNVQGKLTPSETLAFNVTGDPGTPAEPGQERTHLTRRNIPEQETYKPQRFQSDPIVKQQTNKPQRFQTDQVVKRRIEKLIWTMPKQEKHLPALKLQRTNKRNRQKISDQLQPHEIFWQIVGSGGPGSPCSLFLYTDFMGYFFNCGEGTQRMATSHNFQKTFVNTENIFITRKSWQNLGGLPGMCLSIRGVGSPNIIIHGPPGAHDIWDATKNFLNLVDFDVNMFKEKVYRDNTMNVEEVLLERSSPIGPSQINAGWNNPPHGDNSEYVSSVQAYICHFIPRVGKLDVEMCVDAGCPPGPLFGQLKAGKDITLEDGRVIRSQDVLAHSSPASSSVVIEVPEPEYLDSLLESVPLKEIKNLQHVFHFTPREVAEDQRYVSWMKGFPSTVNHVFINQHSTGIGLNSVSLLQARLNMINPTLFPSLAGTCDDPVPGFDWRTELLSNKDGLNVIQGKTGLKLYVRPSKEEMIALDDAFFYDQETEMQGILQGNHLEENEREDYVKGLREDLEYAKNFNPSNDTGGAKIYPEVTFLGTGSAIPSKYRNVSSILVETGEDSFIILDCGEGSLSQLYRLYGKEKTAHILKHLKAIYVSHQHADHQLGSLNLILERTAVFEAAGLPVEKLYFISTKWYGEYLTTYHYKMQDVLANAELVKCEELCFYTPKDEFMLDIPGPKIQLILPDKLRKLLEYTGLSEIETCKAVHCPHAFCLSFRTDAGYKLTYSGDTRPCDALLELGRDSDLLIHEGSMEQRLIQDAIVKKHSTFTEAIQEGKDMGAKFTLLTHFSQRYSKLPLLEEIEGQANVGIAFDNMVVNPQTMKNIPAIYPALKRFFAEEILDMKRRSDMIVSTTEHASLGSKEAAATFDRAEVWKAKRNQMLIVDLERFRAKTEAHILIKQQGQLKLKEKAEAKKAAEKRKLEVQEEQRRKVQRDVE